VCPTSAGSDWTLFVSPLPPLPLLPPPRPPLTLALPPTPSPLPPLVLSNPLSSVRTFSSLVLLFLASEQNSEENIYLCTRIPPPLSLPDRTFSSNKFLVSVSWHSGSESDPMYRDRNKTNKTICIRIGVLQRVLEEIYLRSCFEVIYVELKTKTTKIIFF
jgi:hypothetical protein